MVLRKGPKTRSRGPFAGVPGPRLLSAGLFVNCIAPIAPTAPMALTHLRSGRRGGTSNDRRFQEKPPPRGDPCRHRLTSSKAGPERQSRDAEGPEILPHGLSRERAPWRPSMRRLCLPGNAFAPGRRQTRLSGAAATLRVPAHCTPARGDVGCGTVQPRVEPGTGEALTPKALTAGRGRSGERLAESMHHRALGRRRRRRCTVEGLGQVAKPTRQPTQKTRLEGSSRTSPSSATISSRLTTVYGTATSEAALVAARTIRRSCLTTTRSHGASRHMCPGSIG